MYVTRVPNRGSPPAILLRESYRDEGKVKTRTLANLSRWPEHKVERLPGPKGLPPAAQYLSEAFEITRSLPHGHVAAVLGTAGRLGIEDLIDPARSRRRDLVTAMLVAQVIAPGEVGVGPGCLARPPAARWARCSGWPAVMRTTCMRRWTGRLSAKTASKTSLPHGIWPNGTLVLDDVSSAALEGRTCPLGAIGHARDGVKGRRQIVYGLLCSTAPAVPVALRGVRGATPPTRKPWPPRSKSSGTGSG